MRGKAYFTVLSLLALSSILALLALFLIVSGQNTNAALVSTVSSYFSWGLVGYFIKEYAAESGLRASGVKTAAFALSMLLAVGSSSVAYFRPQLEHQERVQELVKSFEIARGQRQHERIVHILREIKRLEPEYTFSSGQMVGRELTRNLVEEGNRWLEVFATDNSGNVLILRTARQWFSDALAEERANPEAWYGLARIELYLEGDDAWGRGDWRSAARAFLVLHCTDPDFGGMDLGQPNYKKPKAKSLVALENLATRFEKDGRPLDAHRVREIEWEVAERESLDNGRCKELASFSGIP